MPTALIGRLLASRNPWVMLAAGLVMGYRFLQRRAEQGKSIGPFSRLPGMRTAPGLASGDPTRAYSYGGTR